MTFSLDQIISDKVKPIGLKTIELPFLYRELTKGSTLCVGEGGEGGVEGVSATVLHKNPEENICCIDICDCPVGSYVDSKKQLPNFVFRNEDFVNIPSGESYNNVVCINVLEHFGFDSGILTMGYDLNAVKKMGQIANKKIILTVPYGYSPMIDDGSPISGRVYTPERIKTIVSMLRDYKFSVTSDLIIADIFKRLDFKMVTDQYAYELYCRNRYQHEFLRLLAFTKL